MPPITVRCHPSEYGEVLFTQHFDPATGKTRVRIERADPRARISSEYVINWHELRPPYIDCTAPGVFTISDDYGQRFIYRVDFEDYDLMSHSYGMEWPD